VELTGFDVRAFLAEDVGDGDVTAEAVVPADARLEASMLSKEEGIVCGLDVVEAVFRELDPDVRFEPLARDGDVVRGEVARISGSARALLTGERTALNLLGRLSGVATLTRRYVEAVAGTGAVILDTRKTTPGLRALEKLAVRTGGGTNHRFGLYDAVLIKDNHLRLGGGVAASVRCAQETGLPVEVECETLDDVQAAVDAGADTILLDNMTPAQLRDAVGLIRGRARTEASGGITLETIREVAASGVDAISVGALTHSARSLDVSMEVR
jgi:nicotinate-nucleotide pyrophosphorylase (carboxylating)